MNNLPRLKRCPQPSVTRSNASRQKSQVWNRVGYATAFRELTTYPEGVRHG